MATRGHMVYTLYSDTFVRLDDPAFVPTVLQEVLAMLRTVHAPTTYFPATAVPFYIFRVDIQPTFYYLEDKTNAENPVFDDYTWIMYLIEVLSHGTSLAVRAAGVVVVWVHESVLSLFDCVFGRSMQLL